LPLPDTPCTVEKAVLRNARRTKPGRRRKVDGTNQIVSAGCSVTIARLTRWPFGSVSMKETCRKFDPRSAGGRMGVLVGEHSSRVERWQRSCLLQRDHVMVEQARIVR